MNIPEEAVEAAAIALENAVYPNAWDDITEITRKMRKDSIRHGLEAAAPFIAAQALRDFGADLVEFMGPDQELNGLEIQAQADDQADALEGK